MAIQGISNYTYNGYVAARTISLSYLEKIVDKISIPVIFGIYFAYMACVTCFSVKMLEIYIDESIRLTYRLGLEDTFYEHLLTIVDCIIVCMYIYALRRFSSALPDLFAMKNDLIQRKATENAL